MKKKNKRKRNEKPNKKVSKDNINKLKKQLIIILIKLLN